MILGRGANPALTAVNGIANGAPRRPAEWQNGRGMIRERSALPMPDPLDSLVDQWRVAACTGNIVLTRALGAEAATAVQAQRFAALVRHARAHSPWYRHAWRHLPEGPLALHDLPVTTKAELMAAFDEWCTDRAIRRADVEHFTRARAHIGERFRGQYLVWTSSGTTGTPGVFLQDADALAAYDALVCVQFMGAIGLRCDWAAAAAVRGRAALIAADCDHFASIASWRRVAQARPWLDMRSFPVTLPLPELVAALNDYQPAFVSSYPTVLAMLATEQRAGRLDLRPVSLWAGGEVLSRATQASVEEAFACPLQNEYGASECLTIGYGCSEGALHVNADWVILEPVDRHYHPTPPGELSHTVLLTNLANMVQPIVRYDLGDRVRAAALPCPCGNALPAIHVEGRCDDVLVLHNAAGSQVPLPPLALTTVVEDGARIHRFQIVQTAPATLSLRLPAGERVRAAGPALAALRHYLDAQGLRQVTVRLDPHEPQPDARDGKLRQVIALPAG
jgi:phenylacetate-CoA ligase